MSQENNPKFHNLLIYPWTQAEREQQRLDNTMGEAIKDRILQMEGKAPLGQATIAGQQDLTAEQIKMLPYVMAMYANCYLCNADPPPIGMWTWEQGDQRIVTPLCETCIRIVGVRDIIRRALQELSQ